MGLGVLYVHLWTDDVWSHELCHCDPGAYVDEHNSVSCKLCPLGYYCQHDTIFQCSSGTTTYALGATAKTDCCCTTPEKTNMWPWILTACVLSLCWFAIGWFGGLRRIRTRIAGRWRPSQVARH